jgi:hypothetical protein
MRYPREGAAGKATAAPSVTSSLVSIMTLHMYNDS